MFRNIYYGKKMVGKTKKIKKKDKDNQDLDQSILTNKDDELVKKQEEI